MRGVAPGNFLFPAHLGAFAKNARRKNYFHLCRNWRPVFPKHDYQSPS